MQKRLFDLLKAGNQYFSLNCSAVLQGYKVKCAKFVRLQNTHVRVAILPVQLYTANRRVAVTNSDRYDQFYSLNGK